MNENSDAAREAYEQKQAADIAAASREERQIGARPPMTEEAMERVGEVYGTPGPAPAPDATRNLRIQGKDLVQHAARGLANVTAPHNEVVAVLSALALVTLDVRVDLATGWVEAQASLPEGGARIGVQE